MQRRLATGHPSQFSYPAGLARASWLTRTVLAPQTMRDAPLSSIAIRRFFPFSGSNPFLPLPCSGFSVMVVRQ